MPSLKCTFREFIAILESFGFVVVRTKGSHRQYQATLNEVTYLVTVAYHNINDDITRDVLSSMIRQSGLPKKLFMK